MTGSDPGWRRRLMAEFDELVFQDRTETFGPFDIVAVSRAGEAKTWTAECVQNFYWEQALADLDPATEEAVLAVFRSAISGSRGSQPFAGWSDDDIALIEAFLGPSLEGATTWEELVAAADQWGLTAYTEKRPGAAPTVVVIPRYPVAGGSTGRRLEMPWPNLDVTSVRIRLVDRANPVGGWADRRIVSTSRNFIQAERCHDPGRRHPDAFPLPGPAGARAWPRSTRTWPAGGCRTNAWSSPPPGRCARTICWARCSPTIS